MSTKNNLELALSVGPIMADQQYHNYFYQVDDSHVTSRREEYIAGGGYSGSRITFTVTGNTGQFWLGAIARYDLLSGAVFTDSPLASTNHYFAIGFAVAWIFTKSDTYVENMRIDNY